MRTPITNLDLSELTSLIESWGQSPFRARQIWEWTYRRLAGSTDQMTNLPKPLLNRLAEETVLSASSVVATSVAQDGRVRKQLLRLHDDKTVESVLMLYGRSLLRSRISVCVSTQVGCPLRCPFCATGKQGFERNLDAGEMVEQVLHFARFIQAELHRQPPFIDNIVFMGMGEPLLNYKSLWKAIGILNSPHGLGVGARNMTISTSGIVPAIKRMAYESLQVGLAVSLHAPENSLRNQLVPVNRKYPLEELIPACQEYSRMTGRRVTFEYILFRNINDSIETAAALADLIKTLNCHVNLIRANPTASRIFQQPSIKRVERFQRELNRHGINATIRESLGTDIEAGCGQLRSRYFDLERQSELQLETRARSSE